MILTKQALLAQEFARDTPIGNPVQMHIEQFQKKLMKAITSSAA